MGLECSVERELVRKCREGDSRFYEPLVRAYEEPAMRVAAGMLGGDRAERERRAAEDAVGSGRASSDGRRRQERRQARQEVWDALERISEEHREALVLRELEGFSYAEIAEILDVAEGTVASRLYHARDALRKVLEASS